MTEGTRTKRETTAREWLLWLIAGVVALVIGGALSVPVVTLAGSVAVLVAGVGLVVRLLGKR